jgi:glycosyltransferase involved in cell wall biosynthesis
MTRAPLRILYLIDKLQRAGAQVHLDQLTRHLDPGEFSVAVCCLMRGGPVAEGMRERGLPVDVLGLTTIYGPRAWLALAKLARRLRRHRVNIVHTYLISANIFGTLAARLARGPAVVTTRRDVGISRNWRLRLAEEWVINPLADRVTVNSEAVAEAARRERNLGEDKLTLIPNGVDVGALDPARYPRDAIRREWGLGPDDLGVGAVGHLSPVKGHADLVDAAVRVCTEQPRTRFFLIGDGPLRHALEARARSLGIGDRVTITGVREDVARCVAMLDVVVLPSHSEGMSNALLEAMALGRPVVATHVAGNAELVQDGVSGRLVAVGAPEALAKAVLNLLADPETARRLGCEARRQVADRFPLERVVARHQALYRSLA